MEKRLQRPHGVLAWDDLGPDSAETVLVLLHGFPHDRELWFAQRAAHSTAQQHTRLIIPDLPGFGASAPLHLPSMDAYADEIASILDELGVARAVIGGLSMGGYIALAFWRRHRARVQSLLLIDTKASADNDAAKTKRQELIATVARDGVTAIVESLVPGQLGKTTRATAPETVAFVTTMLGRAAAVGVIGAAQAMLTRDDSTPTLELIDVPVLVLVGDEDVLTPVSDAVRMASAIPGARLVTIPDAGHLAPLEQPATVNAAIAEFLDVIRG
jgi:3-oxoadipate enol-lactonase